MLVSIIVVSLYYKERTSSIPRVGSFLMCWVHFYCPYSAIGLDFPFKAILDGGFGAVSEG